MATAAAVTLTVSTGGAATPILLSVAASTVQGAAIGYVTGGVEGMKNGAADGLMWGGIAAFVGSVGGAIKYADASRKAAATCNKSPSALGKQGEAYVSKN